MILKYFYLSHLFPEVIVLHFTIAKRQILLGRWVRCLKYEIYEPIMSIKKLILVENTTSMLA